MEQNTDLPAVNEFEPRKISLDKLAYFTGLLMPIITLPQLFEVIIQHKTQGVSLVSWSFYMLGSLLFAYYGLRRKIKVMAITYIPSAIIQSVIVIGLIIYR